MSTFREPYPLRNAEEDESDLPETPVYFRRYDTQVIARQISFYLTGEIGPAIAYTDLYNALRTATEYDVVFLHLNTPGGNFDTGLQIINNIHASAAKVVTILEARAYSMGSLIFLSGDELIVNDNCQLMFHNYSGSLIGKGNEQHAQVIAHGKWFEKVMYRICFPFLSLEELVSIKRGEDIWMDSDEVAKRLQRVRTSKQLPSPRTARGKKVAKDVKEALKDVKEEVAADLAVVPANGGVAGGV